MGKGIIYGFTTLASNKIVKIGRTEKSLKQRLRGYIGPSKPRTVIFAKSVDDSVEAENWVKILMAQCCSFTQRCDLGDEWYESKDGASDEVRNMHMLQISQVAQLAARDLPASPSNPKVEMSITPQSQSKYCSMSGMGMYFKIMDDFITRSPQSLNGETAETITKKYEQSTMCPVLTEYLPNTFDQRVTIVSNRYAHILL